MLNSDYISRYRHYLLLLIVFLLSVALFVVASAMHEEFDRVMSVVSYLTWHNLFEFSSILVCFGIFMVAYYTYDQTKNYRTLFFASVFLYMGIMDFFHTLSFKGMPEFFIENRCANRATTLWIAARLLGGAGLAVASFLPVNLKVNVNKRLFPVVTLAVAFSIFGIASYYPYVIPPMYVNGTGLTQLKINMEYVIALLFAVTMGKFIYDYSRTGEKSALLFSVSMLLSIFSEFAFISYGSVYDIYNYIGHIYKVIAFFIFLRIVYIHDVQIPYMELFKARELLKEHADNLDRMVEKRTLELKSINNNLVKDLEYARDIQKSLLPHKLPDETEVAFDTRYFPAEHVGGDFYNIFKLDDRNIGIYIGDVSGHGVSAAMLTVFMNQTIKSVYGDGEYTNKIISPSVVLKNVYRSFNKNDFKEEIYIVLLYAVLNLDTKELTYASAGINVQPLIMDSDTGRVSELEVKGFPICKFIEFYSGEYKDMTIKLKSGDKLLFYTDGLVEAENRQGEIFSQKRLAQVLEQNSALEGDVLSEVLTREVFNFVEYRELKDDLTFVLMHIK